MSGPKTLMLFVASDIWDAIIFSWLSGFRADVAVILFLLGFAAGAIVGAFNSRRTEK